MRIYKKGIGLIYSLTIIWDNWASKYYNGYNLKGGDSVYVTSLRQWELTQKNFNYEQQNPRSTKEKSLSLAVAQADNLSNSFRKTESWVHAPKAHPGRYFPVFHDSGWILLCLLPT